MAGYNTAHDRPGPEFFIPETEHPPGDHPHHRTHAQSVLLPLTGAIFRTTLAEFHSRARRIVRGALIPTTVGLDNPALSQQNVSTFVVIRRAIDFGRARVGGPKGGLGIMWKKFGKERCSSFWVGFVEKATVVGPETLVLRSDSDFHGEIEKYGTTLKVHLRKYCSCEHDKRKRYGRGK